MDQLDIERVGGLGAFGGPNLQSTGRISTSKLSPADQGAVDALFEKPPTDLPNPDEFSYRLTRQTTNGPQTIQVREKHVPLAVRSTVKDEIR